MLNINLHHIHYYFNITLPLFTDANLVHININICIFLLLNVAPSPNLVFVPGSSIQINTVSWNWTENGSFISLFDIP